MALSNKIDPVAAGQQLAAWLAIKTGGQDVKVSDVRVPASAGLSAETVLFEAAWREQDEQRRRRLAARVAPAGEAVFPTYDLHTEYRVMAALGCAGLPLPEVLWHERDPSILGGEFVVMEQVDGRVPADDPPYTVEGWVVDLAPGEQALLYDNALQALAKLHTLDWRAAGLDALDREPGLDQQLAYWESTYAWAADGESNPTVDGAFDWVREHQPRDDGRPVVCWGDARLGNILFADDLSVAALLDWEMATLGSPELDLGWWLFLIRNHTAGLGAPMPAGFPSREATVARYEELTRHTVEHLEFYEVFAALRLAIIMHRAGNLMISAGLLPPGAPMRLNNPITQLLAEMLELPAPEGTVQSFVGNR